MWSIITHEVAPHDVLEGALTLEAAAPRFPAATIHVAVVDPGVGTARRALAVAARDQMFVGPDNGLFTPFLGDPRLRAFELSAAEFRGTAVSRTFHGRDIFAPAAAHLARGIEPARLGSLVTDPVRLAWPEVRVSEGRVGGAVVHVDRFWQPGDLDPRRRDRLARVGRGGPRRRQVAAAGADLR